MIFKTPEVERRSHLFAQAKDMMLTCEPDGWPRQTILEQLEYLSAVNEGRMPGDRLANINLGVVTAKMIEPADERLLTLLYEVSATANKMADEARGGAH